LDVFARYTSSRITFLTLTIVSISRGDVRSHQDIFQTFGFPESHDGWFGEGVTAIRSLTFDLTKQVVLTEKYLIQYKEKNTNNSVPLVITYHPALSNLSNIVREHWTTIQKHPELCTIFVKSKVNDRIAVTPLFQMTCQFPKRCLVVCSLEQIPLIRRAWLYGIRLVQCLG
jgi:hypothetical protein